MIHYINSQNRTDSNDPPTNFKIELLIPSSHDRVSLVSANFMKSFYTITDGENTFKINSTTYTVPEGSYELQDFIDEVNTLITAVGTLTFSNLTGKMTITSSTATTFTPQSLCKYFGFEDTIYNFSSQTVTSINICDFQKYDELYLTTDIVATNSINVFDNVLHNVFVTSVPYNSDIYYENPQIKETSKELVINRPYIQDSVDRLIKRVVQFSLIDKDGNVIDLNGQDLRLVITTYINYEKKTFTMLKEYLKFRLIEYENSQKIKNIEEKLKS